MEVKEEDKKWLHTFRNKVPETLSPFVSLIEKQLQSKKAFISWFN